MANVALGHFESAIQQMQAESTLAQARGDPVTAILCLAKAGWDATMAGGLQRAWQFTGQTLHLIQTLDGHMPASVCWPYARRADILREWNRLEEAQDLAEQAIQLGEQTETLAFLPIGYTTLLKIALSQGVWEEAAKAHQRMEDAWRAMPAPYRFALYSRVYQVRYWLASGNLERASRWANSLEQEEPLVSPLARERQHIALARVRLAESRPDQVLALLAPLVARAQAMGRWDQVLEMRLLQAQAYHMRKMPQEALAILAQAVHLAEPEGYIRRFVPRHRLFSSSRPAWAGGARPAQDAPVLLCSLSWPPFSHSSAL
jgi:LuxR family maltose regulon positive regulatory protein